MNELTEALFKMSKSGDRQNAVRFIDKGADVNSRDASGDTPLMHACMHGFTEQCFLHLTRRC